MPRKALLLGLAVLTAVGIAFPGAARAQEEGSAPEPALGDGAWALQFRIRDNFTLGPFQGAVISIKHHHSERSAVRLGLGLDFSAKNTDTEETQGGVITSASGVDQSSQAFQLDLQYVRYANPAAPVKLMFGFGPLAGFRHSSETYGSGTQHEIETKSWSAGVSGLIGVEWFAASRISLLAEYGIEFVYTHSKYDRWYDTGRTIATTDKGGALQPTSVLFGLSAYF